MFSNILVLVLFTLIGRFEKMGSVIYYTEVVFIPKEMEI